MCFKSRDITQTCLSDVIMSCPIGKLVLLENSERYAFHFGCSKLWHLVSLFLRLTKGIVSTDILLSYSSISCFKPWYPIRKVYSFGPRKISFGNSKDANFNLHQRQSHGNLYRVPNLRSNSLLTTSPRLSLRPLMFPLGWLTLLFSFTQRFFFFFSSWILQFNDINKTLESSNDLDLHPVIVYTLPPVGWFV